MPAFLVFPGVYEPDDELDLANARLVERDSAQAAAQLYYNHAVVVACDVFPEAAEKDWE